MLHSQYPDPSLLDPQRIEPAIHERNMQLSQALQALPDWWVSGPHAVRESQRQGMGPWPAPMFSERARVRTIAGPAGDLLLRELLPAQGKPQGVYLHIHGGGWVLGEADLQDSLLLALADLAQLAVLSVHYRLAPEHPYPAAPDDCEAAALWLVHNARELYGTDRLFIGGESAGGHLGAVTLLRLRQRLGHCPFAGAVLNFGVFDLGLTPSARAFGQERLILRTLDIVQFRHAFLSGAENLRDPDISPLHANLTGLCPALFTVGTRDALLDDSLFMHARWMAAGNVGQLDVYPGAPHGFFLLGDGQTRQSLQRQIGFLRALCN